MKRPIVWNRNLKYSYERVSSMELIRSLVVCSVAPSGNMTREQSRRKLNRKMSLTELERKLIHKKKNKLLSFAVLNKNKKGCDGS